MKAKLSVLAALALAAAGAQANPVPSFVDYPTVEIAQSASTGGGAATERAAAPAPSFPY